MFNLLFIFEILCVCLLFDFFWNYLKVVTEFKYIQVSDKNNKHLQRGGNHCKNGLNHLQTLTKVLLVYIKISN